METFLGSVLPALNPVLGRIKPHPPPTPLTVSSSQLRQYCLVTAVITRSVCFTGKNGFHKVSVSLELMMQNSIELSPSIK